MAKISSSTPYHKRNLGWSLSWEGGSFGQRTLVERFESALIHLAKTPKGSYYADPDYGTNVYRLRTQNMNEGLIAAILQDVKLGVSKYVPDIVINDLLAEIDMDAHSLKVWVKWSVKGADSEMHGDLATERVAFVSL